MSKDNIIKASMEVFEILKKFEPDEVNRVLDATQALMGKKSFSSDDSSVPPDSEIDSEEIGKLPSKVKVWMQQNKLKSEDIAKIFHFEDGKAELIVPRIPGKGKREKTLNVYILIGVGQFLLLGDSTFEDKTARDLCSAFQCFDDRHHAEYLEVKGIGLIGSKKNGWKLTIPGLTSGSMLIKEMSQDDKTTENK